MILVTIISLQKITIYICIVAVLVNTELLETKYNNVCWGKKGRNLSGLKENKINEDFALSFFFLLEPEEASYLIVQIKEN